MFIGLKTTTGEVIIEPILQSGYLLDNFLRMLNPLRRAQPKTRKIKIFIKGTPENLIKDYIIDKKTFFRQ